MERAPIEWNVGRERLAAAIFAPLAAAIARLPIDRWPTHDDLTALADGVTTARGQPLRFVGSRGPPASGTRGGPPASGTGGDHTDGERRYYEQRIAETGEVETRPENWHDLFNALAWITFPKAKAAINAQHAAILEEGGEVESRHRSPERDALTLFDEGGVIVAARSPQLLRLIVDFEWKELFWNRRADLEANVRFLAFGHACFEQSLEPYIGMVAKTVFVPVDELFFMLPIESQVAQADALVAAHFGQRTKFHSPKAMAPMPVLGVPGWHFAAQDEAFYDDPKHFRSKNHPAAGRGEGGA